jgi:WD40 repeat protein
MLSIGEVILNITNYCVCHCRVLYLVCGSTVRAYAVKTGELLNEYERKEGKIIGVQLHPANPEVLVACSENGELIQWNCNSRFPASVVVS